MTKPLGPLPSTLDPLAPLPGWIVHDSPQTLEDATFFAGAALAHLHGVLRHPTLPRALLRARLALAAAERVMVLTGRSERRAELRDALHLRRPGDAPGPAGEVLLCWSRAAERAPSAESLARALRGVPAEWIVLSLEADGPPIARAAAVLEAVLTQAPRAETMALVLADAALARALGWDAVVPLLGGALRRADLAARGDDLRLACHKRLPSAVRMAVQEALDLARRAERLKAVAPKLRTKGAGRVLELFLTQDALAPAALVHLLSDRAARRLCDRLVALDAIRELTGRDSFRLYGV
ncbi:MAG: DUF1403 family protein [Paracoccaceae bacterium]|nr:DUF1403 family protein [Paracoccaceae bacterium]